MIAVATCFSTLQVQIGPLPCSSQAFKSLRAKPKMGWENPKEKPESAGKIILNPVYSYAMVSSVPVAAVAQW